MIDLQTNTLKVIDMGLSKHLTRSVAFASVLSGVSRPAAPAARQAPVV